MARGQINRLIGALFGLIFIEANAGALPSSVGIPLRVLRSARSSGCLSRFGAATSLRRPPTHHDRASADATGPWWPSRP